MQLSFQDQYGNPIVTSSSATDVFLDPTNTPIQRLTLTLHYSYALLPTSFPSSLLSEIASLLSLSSPIQLRLDSYSGSATGQTVVTFDILPPLLQNVTFGAPVNGYYSNLDLASQFQSYFNSPNSLLYSSGIYLSTAVTASGLVVTPICQNPEQVIIGCPSTPQDSPISSSSGTNDTLVRWLIIGLSLFVLLVLVIIGVLIHRRDRQKQEQLEEKAAEAEHELVEYEKTHPDAAQSSSHLLPKKPEVVEVVTSGLVSASPAFQEGPTQHPATVDIQEQTVIVEPTSKLQSSGHQLGAPTSP